MIINGYEVTVLATIQVNKIGSGTLDDPYRPQIAEEAIWRVKSDDGDKFTIEKLKITKL